ncbi:flavin reductase family protein [Zongyangia hominis]|uniref:Flavin reductase family protein n=1 Tax=Zongyangia hominis TaxID=2763677 RepID=A0A926EDA1_9FIRM|nr:flavin reductase family protein [Zongyangia hominis]MBC8570953.1 flavin reductase family protein [Zongyangia hominis]
MGKVLWNPGTLLGPVPPALVTCGSMERPNILTVAWTGIVNTKPPMTYVSVRPERYSYPLIRSSGEFVINLTIASMVRAADFCGVKSGRDLDKFAACGLHAIPGSKVTAPVLKESPLSLECRVKDVLELGSHHMFLAEILGLDVEEGLIDKDGGLHLERAGLMGYAHGAYYALGERLGTFGYSVRKKPLKKRGRPQKE